jgi:TRAP-type C4-dicarboxylate transport system substrate-binding protein
MLAVLAVALTALSPAKSFAQDSVNLRFLTAWDDRFDGTQIVAKQFAENVEKASDGRITFTFSGPEVVPPNQQFEPVTRGVFDLGFITPIYYIGTTGVPFAFFALPPDPALWRERGYWAFADKEMARFNQKLLSFVSGSDSDDFYQIILREPLPDTDQPFAGKKIRGNKYYEPIVVPLGGSLVNLPGGEIYSALEKGVVDGAAYPVAGMQKLKMQEVTKYMMRPRFGTSPFTVAMNLDKFNALSEVDRTLLLEEGRKLEELTARDFSTMADETVEALKAEGMEETTLAPALFEKVNAGLKAGVWKTAVEGNKQTADRVGELHEMAKKNGDAE